MLSEVPFNLGLNDLIAFLSISDPSFVSNATLKFSLYFAGQLPNWQFKVLFLKLHLGSNSSISKFFGNLSLNETSLIS